MFIFVLPLIALAVIFIPFISIIRGKATQKRAKKAFITNLCSFAGVLLVAIAVPLTGFADAATETASNVISTGTGMGYLAAALVTGLSAIGAGIAVAAAAPAAIGACSENPKSFTRSLIFVSLGEGVAIYGLLISILIITSLK